MQQLPSERLLRRCMFFLDCIPVWLGLTRHPADLSWSGFSSCRTYAFGEPGRVGGFLQAPRWYLDLGADPTERQKRYRFLLERYLVEYGASRYLDTYTGYIPGSRHRPVR
jgi:hypothetical protein